MTSFVKYSRDHEWVRVEGATATIGITDYAQGQLGDVVFVELPAVGRQLAALDPAAVVESVKAASDVYSPVGGEVIAVNEALADAPDLVNRAAEGAGWFFTLTLQDMAQCDALMDLADYQRHCQGEA